MGSYSLRRRRLQRFFALALTGYFAFAAMIGRADLSIEFKFDDGTTSKVIPISGSAQNFQVNVWAHITSTTFNSNDGFQAAYWGAISGGVDSNRLVASPSISSTTISGGTTNLGNAGFQQSTTYSNNILSNAGPSQYGTVADLNVDTGTNVPDLGGAASTYLGWVRSSVSGVGVYVNAAGVGDTQGSTVTGLMEGAVKTSVDYSIVIGTFTVTVPGGGAANFGGSAGTAFTFAPSKPSGILASTQATWKQDGTMLANGNSYLDPITSSPTTANYITSSLNGVTFTTAAAAVGVPSGSGSWVGATSNNWDTNTSANNNWATGIPNAANQTATFDGTATLIGPIDVASSKTIGGLSVSGGAYTIGTTAAAQTLSFNNGGTATITTSGAFAQGIAARIATVAANTLNITNTATSLTLTGGIDNTAAQTVAVSNSTVLNLDGTAQSYAVSTISGAGSTTVTAGNTLTATTVTQAGLTIGTGASVSAGVTISGAIANSGSLTITGAGSTSGNITGAGTLTVNATKSLTAGNVAGTTVTANGNLTANRIQLTGTAALTVGTGATATIAASAISAFPYPSGDPAQVSVVKTLTLTGTGTLDLKNNDLIVDYTGATPLAAIETKINTAYNFGAWDQPGITSSTAALSSLLHTLGAIEAADYNTWTGNTDFDGVTFDADAVLVKYTWAGDANLTGIVDIDDYFLIDTGFANTLTGWLNGDFDYNGAVDIDDYFLIDTAFANGADLNSLPEPSSLVLVALGVVGVVASRRRRRCADGC